MWSDEQLAGWLEGEGSFFLQQRRAWISASSTDHDVVVEVARALGTSAMGPRQNPRPNRKPYWSVSLTGKRALVTMLRVYPFLGERRRATIQSVLSRWEHEIPGVGSGRRGISRGPRNVKR